MADDEVRIARLTPLGAVGVAGLLRLPLGLDVWERHPDHLVVAAPESRLAELERRRLARVDRWATRQDYERRHDVPLAPDLGLGGLDPT